MLDARLNRVDSTADAEAFLRWLGERRPVLAIDTETTGLEWWTPGFLRLVQFGDANAAWTISARRWLGLLEEALPRISGPVVFHNAKFDLHALASKGLRLPSTRIHDTFVMHALVHPLERHGLKDIAVKLYGPDAGLAQIWLQDKMRRNRWTWETIPEDEPAYSLYAGMDAVLTARLAEHLWPSVSPDPYHVEMQVLHVMFRAERRGIRIDTAYARHLRDRWSEEADALSQRLQEAGIENPNSNRQITDALQAAGWEPEDWTPTGQAKLDVHVLKALSKQYGELAATVLRYRRLAKWLAAYLAPFSRSERVHPSINTLAARTGRMSITNPPLQTLPRGAEIRNCVIPEPEHDFYTADFDAQEIRLLVHYSQEPGLAQALREGKDLHRYAAALVYNTDYEAVTSQQRQVTKSTQYGLCYGAGPAKLAQTAGVSEPEIKDFLSRYHTLFPGVKGFMREVEALARTRFQEEGAPYIVTWGGRKLYAEPDKAYRLVNYLIQGSAADLLKHKILDLDKAGLGDYIVVPVHDELTFSIPRTEPEAIKEIVTIMQEPDAFSVPLPCSASEPAPSWGEAVH